MLDTFFATGPESFVLGVTAFWVTTVVLFFLLCLFIEGFDEPKSGAAIGVLLLYLAATHFMGASIFSSAKAAGASEVLSFVLQFVTIGAVWITVKWFFFTWKWRIRYLELKEKFLSSAGVDRAAHTVLLCKSADFTDFLEKQVGYEKYKLYLSPPKFSKHLDLAVNWGMFWPFSMVGTIFGSGFRWLWRYIVSMLTGFMDMISRFHARGLSSDFEQGK